MARYLYILCEGELDEMFYERVAERVTGLTFESPSDFRLRRGSNWKTAMNGARLLLGRVRHWQEQQDICVIVAVDNDRAPGHPGASPPARQLPSHDLKKEPRYPALKKLINQSVGEDPSTRKVEVALALPVEMIESWVLSLLNPNGANLPIFAEANSASARLYHGKNPPPQLKDLRDAEAKSRGRSLADLFWEAAESDLESACASSPSLKMFVAELTQWRRE